MSEERYKEIKVRISLRWYARLHALKIVKGQKIHDSVEQALAQYLARPENRTEDTEAGALAGAADAIH